MTRIAILLLAAVALAAPAAYAQKEHDHDKHGAQPVSPVKLTAGVVKKIDRESGKISISHGPIENLGMPAMTMVFRASAPGMLEKVKEGDKIRFAADKVDETYVVTRIEVAK